MHCRLGTQAASVAIGVQVEAARGAHRCNSYIRSTPPTMHRSAGLAPNPVRRENQSALPGYGQSMDEHGQDGWIRYTRGPWAKARTTKPYG